MRVAAAPVISMACHCRGCQKLTSGPYSLTMMVPKAGFEVLEGATEIGALHKSDIRHHYCVYCKSWVYTEGERLQGFVNFRSTMLEDARWVSPYIESYTAEKLPGVVSGAKKSFEGFPPSDQYGPLMEAYAREGVRPGS